MSQLFAAADRRRDNYAEAVAVLLSWCEYPYMIRRRVDDEPAAYAYAIVKAGYSPERASFSRYRRFSRDLITKKSGQRYETDAEFAGDDGSVELHIEVKTSEEVEGIAAQNDVQAELGEFPLDVVKELEYVLDLASKYLWIVGPGTVDPPAHVFSVEVDGHNARFERVSGLRTQRSGKC